MKHSEMKHFANESFHRGTFVLFGNVYKMRDGVGHSLTRQPLVPRFTYSRLRADLTSRHVLISPKRRASHSVFWRFLWHVAFVHHRTGLARRKLVAALVVPTLTLAASIAADCTSGRRGIAQRNQLTRQRASMLKLRNDRVKLLLQYLRTIHL